MVISMGAFLLSFFYVKSIIRLRFSSYIGYSLFSVKRENVITSIELFIVLLTFLPKKKKIIYSTYAC